MARATVGVFQICIDALTAIEQSVPNLFITGVKVEDMDGLEHLERELEIPGPIETPHPVCLCDAVGRNAALRRAPPRTASDIPLCPVCRQIFTRILHGDSDNVLPSKGLRRGYKFPFLAT